MIPLYYKSDSRLITYIILMVILVFYLLQRNESQILATPCYFSPHPTLLLIPLPSSKASSGGNQASGSVFLSCRSPQVPTCQYPRQRLGSAVAQLTSSPTATTQGAPVPLPAQRQARSTPAPPILSSSPTPKPHKCCSHISKGQCPGSSSRQYGSWRQFSPRWRLRCFGWRSRWKLTDSEEERDIGEKWSLKEGKAQWLSDKGPVMSSPVSISGKGKW